MPYYKRTPKCGPYPQEKLVKMKNEYENYIRMHKHIRCSQNKRLENIIKVIDLAIDKPGEELNPDYVSKKIKVSKGIVESYLNVIYLEINGK